MEVMTGKRQTIAVRGAETMELGPASLKINHCWGPLFPAESVKFCVKSLIKIVDQEVATKT
jgi:hypothetical protein